MRVRIRRLSWVGLVCVPAVLCGAQSAASPKPNYRLTGLVVDSAGLAVEQAQVELVEAGLVVARLRSDTTGHFLASDLHVRSFDVSVRRIGFEPRTVAMQIPADLEQGDMRIVMVHSAAQLSATEVLAERSSNVRLRTFYDRLAHNKYGSYIEPETIERRQPSFTSELLRAVPGVRVQPSARSGNRVTIRGCAPVVWVDGARMQDAQLDDVVQPQDVAAIEIYRSFSGLPSEYFDRTANCGTIIVWTKLR
jgi:hypothetical protein